MKYVIGFDADTNKCGLVFLNTAKQKMSSKLLCYNDLITHYMPYILRNIRKQDLLVRIELPSLRTAMSINRNKHGIDKAQGLYHSGRCSELARKFQKYCLDNSIPYVCVKSENRIRCDRPNLKSIEVKKIVSMSKKYKRQGKFLSKLDYYRAKQIFTQLSVLNDEVIDAALLVLPEYRYKQHELKIAA